MKLCWKVNMDSLQVNWQSAWLSATKQIPPVGLKMENQHCIYSGIILGARLRQVTQEIANVVAGSAKVEEVMTVRGLHNTCSEKALNRWVHVLTLIKAASWHLQATSQKGNTEVWFSRTWLIHKGIPQLKICWKQQKSYTASGQTSLTQSMWADKITVL